MIGSVRHTFFFDMKILQKGLFDIIHVAGGVRSEQTVGHDCSRCIFQGNGPAVKHIRLHLIPESIPAASLSDGDAA